MATHTLDHPKPTYFPHKAAVHLEAVDSHEETITSVATGRWLAVSRIGVGFIFLWAFLDKTFGLGYATPSANAWIHGGSPTKGFLSNVGAGPFASAFHSMAGNPIINVLFMAGMLGVGAAVIAGVALRPAAIAGTVILLMMWAAEWPMAKTGAAGPTSSTNPFVDYHLVYALALIVVASLSAGRTWGLGDRWARLPIVRDHRILR